MASPVAHPTIAFLDPRQEFVRFLVGEGWLAHYLDFAGERSLPPMPKLRDLAIEGIAHLLGQPLHQAIKEPFGC